MPEVNAMEPALVQDALTPSGTLTALVQAPVVLDDLAGKGVTVSDSVAGRDADKRGLRDPSDSTLEIVQLATAIGTPSTGGQITEADAQALTQQLQSRRSTSTRATARSTRRPRRSSSPSPAGSSRSRPPRTPQ